jgi:hypothetical protein
MDRKRFRPLLQNNGVNAPFDLYIMIARVKRRLDPLISLLIITYTPFHFLKQVFKPTRQPAEHKPCK